MNVKIIVATHKRARMPDDAVYLPVHAGRRGKEDIGYIGDDTGENISDQNWYYNECTAVYWAWKNLPADAVGLVHYRRHFTKKSLFARAVRGKWECVLTGAEAEKLMSEHDIVVAKPRRYVVETIASHFAHAHNPQELELLRRIIGERCPEYLSALETLLHRRWAHMFNMFIMSRERFDEYCAWLFDVLLEFGRRVDMSDYPPEKRRAFISERLLDVWLIKNGYPYKEVSVMYMEKQNWPKKIWRFLQRKIASNHSI